MVSLRNKSLWLLAGLLAVSTTAQQFADITVFQEYPGLSAQCSDALNATINCSSILISISQTHDFLSPIQLTYLCTEECQDSMAVVRNSIQTACTLATDAIVDSGIAYPATWIIDNYIYAFNSSCRKDKTTNQFCDTLIQSWANDTNASSISDQECSDCILGIMQIELASPSPIGYNEVDAENFASATSSCGSTGYSFVTPAPYALNGTGAVATTSSVMSTTSSAAESTCTTGTYTVATGDNCNDVAFAHNVSTFALLYQNNLNAYCADFVPGVEVCLPLECDVRVVQSNDTCLGVVQSTETQITVTQLQAWNPNINMICGNLPRMNGTVICTSPPGGYQTTASSSNSSGITAISAAPIPTNVPVGTNHDCGQYYTIQGGDTCDTISVKKSISVRDFLFLNPEINANCTNILAGLSYCVAPVGSISTYANYTTGTTPTTSYPCGGLSAPAYCTQSEIVYPTTINMAGNWTRPQTTAATATPTPLLPLAPGTISNCSEYQSYQNISGVDPWFVQQFNGCPYVAQNWEIQVSDLMSWNPSLSSSDCSFQPGYRYCVLISQNFTLIPPPTAAPSSFCEEPGSIMEGTIATCNCYATIFGCDADDYPCDAFAEDYNLNVTTLLFYNSWIGNNCTSGLFANLACGSTRSVCVGITNSTSTTNTSSLASALAIEGRGSRETLM